MFYVNYKRILLRTRYLNLLQDVKVIIIVNKIKSCILGKKNSWWKHTAPRVLLLVWFLEECLCKLALNIVCIPQPLKVLKIESRIG